MKDFKSHVKYAIRKQQDGSYVILQKYRNKVDIHSHYDTLEEAQDAWDDLHAKPSQAETLDFFHGLKNAMDYKHTI